MKYDLTPGWTSDLAGQHLILRSETAELKIALGHRAGLAAALVQNGWAESEAPDLEALRAELSRRRVLTPSVGATALDQARQIQYWRTSTDDPHRAVELVRRSTVSIAGLGGVGGVVMEHLVAAGVRNFRLLDMDRVEESNLNRQFIFARADVGEPKVEAAARYVLSRQPDADVEVVHAPWDASDDRQQDFLFAGASAVVSAIDTPSFGAAVELLSRSWLAGTVSISGTVGLNRSLVSPVFDPARSRRSPALVFRSSRKVAARFLASHGPTNTVPAAVAADQLLHHLAGAVDLVDYERPLIMVRDSTGGYQSTRVDEVSI